MSTVAKSSTAETEDGVDITNYLSCLSRSELELFVASEIALRSAVFERLAKAVGKDITYDEINAELQDCLVSGANDDDNDEEEDISETNLDESHAVTIINQVYSCVLNLLHRCDSYVNIQQLSNALCIVESVSDFLIHKITKLNLSEEDLNEPSVAKILIEKLETQWCNIIKAIRIASDDQEVDLDVLNISTLIQAQQTLVSYKKSLVNNFGPVFDDAIRAANVTINTNAKKSKKGESPTAQESSEAENGIQVKKRKVNS